MKDCLIIGPAYSLSYNDVYPLLLNKTLKVGVYKVGFANSNGYPCSWLTNLQPNRPEEKKLKLTSTYNPDDYPRFDNAPDIIESKSKNIPVDYPDKIGVPITFFYYYPELDYEILEKRGDLVLNGKKMFERLIIRRKQL